MDIGTGTGLLALMMAQKRAGQVDAVELDESAAAQARENSEASPWNDKIQVHHQKIQDFAKEARRKYDLIICNPPYFAQGLSSGNIQRDQARSGKFLPVEDLVEVMEGLLAKDGHASLILPIDLQRQMEQRAALAGLFVHRLVSVRPTPEKEPHRVLVEFRRGFPAEIHREDLTIRTEHGRYTDPYLGITGDFYLFPN